mmetsp:Transcript_879/g.1601  ORF Transcript_879/g.1601 Transcript_879/m.1601 type:complete len:389 (+) Transcript_879:200-1366(+)
MKFVYRSHCFSTLFCVDLFFAVCLSLKVPVIFDSSNIWHRSIQYHPEQPARIDACVRTLVQEQPNVELYDVTPDRDTFIIKESTPISHVPFSDSDLAYARGILLQTHSEELLLNLERRCRQARQRRVDEGNDPLGFIGYIDDDTFVTTESYDVCLRAAASWIRAVDYALDGKRAKQSCRNAVFALTRPPGHHATFNLSNGFCLLNFAAAAIKHALKKDRTIKISVFDWDVHYGQGVAEAVQNCSRARYVSVHQSEAFPYMGTKLEVTGQHKNIKTVPISAETSWACGYSQKFEVEVLPFLKSEDWIPDLVLICAGYDALDSDELASVSLQARDYGEMTRKLLQHLCRDDCKIPVVLGLEGGYQLSKMAGGGNMPEALVETIRAFQDEI